MTARATSFVGAALLAGAVAGCGEGHHRVHQLAPRTTPSFASTPNDAFLMRRDSVLRHNVAEICATSNSQTIADVSRDALGAVYKTPPNMDQCSPIYHRAFAPRSFTGSASLILRAYNWIDCEGRFADGKVVIVREKDPDRAAGTVTGIDGQVRQATFHRDAPGGGWAMSELCQTSPPS